MEAKLSRERSTGLGWMEVGEKAIGQSSGGDENICWRTPGLLSVFLQLEARCECACVYLLTGSIDFSCPVSSPVGTGCAWREVMED